MPFRVCVCARVCVLFIFVSSCDTSPPCFSWWGGVGLVPLFFFEIFVYNGTVVVIWVVAVAFFCCFCGWVGVQIFFGCLVFVRRGDERSSLFLFVCLWEGVVAVSCGFFGSWGFFFPHLLE